MVLLDELVQFGQNFYFKIRMNHGKNFKERCRYESVDYRILH